MASERRRLVSSLWLASEMKVATTPSTKHLIDQGKVAAKAARAAAQRPPALHADAYQNDAEALPLLCASAEAVGTTATAGPSPPLAGASTSTFTVAVASASATAVALPAGGVCGLPAGAEPGTG